jgi:hypothetical protein
VGHITPWTDEKSIQNLRQNPEGKRSMCRWEDNIKIDSKGSGSSRPQAVALLTETPESALTYPIIYSSVLFICRRRICHRESPFIKTRNAEREYGGSRRFLALLIKPQEVFIRNLVGMLVISRQSKYSAFN